MALARVHTWIAGEVLTASDLNAEYNNILNNALSLVSPLTGTLNFAGNQATNLRLEVQTATQSAAAEGVMYWQSTEDCLHVSTGTVQARVPAITAMQAGDMIFASNAGGVDGATTYARLPVATSGTQLLGISGGLPAYIPAATASNQLVGVTAAGTGIEHKTVIAGTGMTITHATNAMTFASSATSPFTSSYISAASSFAFSSTVPFVHGLGSIPTLVRVVFRCVTAENGYLIDDELHIVGTWSESNASGTNANVMANATQIKVVIGSGSNILNKDTLSPAAMTAANWNLVARAWV